MTPNRLTAGAAAVCPGEVWHRRLVPVEHSFRYPVQYVWLDPSRPDELTGRHMLWSSRWPAPVWFRRRDFGAAQDRSLEGEVRDAVAAELGERPTGAIRMLTQLRRWGWLFNPITVYVVWEPAAIVLDVTNTPWKERHRYVARLLPDATGSGLSARFDKRLHVSPFLDEQYEYRVRIADLVHGGLRLSIDVVAPDGTTHLNTAIEVERHPASRQIQGRSLWSAPLTTYRVSFEIHRQALRLWRRGVRVVPHPRKRATRE